MKADIKDSTDIKLFVDQFYGKIQQDDLLGPIFGAVIKDWGPHLEKIYQFWNAVLFGVQGFKGNPFARHAPLPISQEHFDRWLILFRETIDAGFEGERAIDVKTRAEIMSVMFVSKLDHMRANPGYKIL
ncbi:group III truncated hemoglobin [Pedobacter sp. MR2016-24]|uniref:group III truncated hemoglobin n=1 Tax=Pedobacter sp. MR2016-24 TaxID=2994466 RepID=UPI00224846E6|nr:group III truncated hemoglobin [Pedobacter sp. MR2016-24]MCX2486386.1 group III truncated hemoglobin [Pedobacter sp. MR2016-24]